MDDDDLLHQSTAWHDQASALLAESQLPGVLHGHGDVVFSGSYAYGTMMSPDVDLHLLLPRFSRPAAVDVLSALLEQDWWNTYTFGDWVQERFRAVIGGRAPRGYLVKLQTNFSGADWTVDGWVLDGQRYDGDVWAPRMASITHDERVAILRIKRARTMGVLHASGVDIYRAVLDGDATDAETFLSWQATGQAG